MEEVVRVLAVLLTALVLPARVIVVSLDGLGHQAFVEDPVTAELTALRAIARRGIQARGMTPHFPSTTANSHAAMFTGAWGDVNGITGNWMPAELRRHHTAFERMNGYRSEGLRAEPLWLAAARQGRKAVAVQVPQAYPFRLMNVGERLRVPPVVVNGYQTKLVAGHRALRRADVVKDACGATCFRWSAGPVIFHGRIDAARRAITISAEGGGGTVTARMAPLESDPPRRRELARHFSEGLYLAQAGEFGPAVVYFRLFEMTREDFLLYQSPIHELGVHHGSEAGREIAAGLLREAGGFIGNGPGHMAMRDQFLLGPPLWRGGDGTAERRYLEAAELVARQAIRHARWFLMRYTPELFIGYLSLPDEFEHNWKGLTVTDSRYNVFRRWGYTIVDRLVAAYAAFTSPRDHLIFVSDHGMAAVTHEVAVDAALRRARLLEVDSKGRVDPARTRAMHIRNCILLNTTDWKGGHVPLADRRTLLVQVGKALLGIVDADGGRVVRAIYESAEDAARLGFGGPAGADLCFDYRPGYGGVDSAELPIVRKAEVAAGVHGFDPTRLDMEAILIGAGPRLAGGKMWPRVRGIDVAPLVADLLGIDAPREVRGRSPLR